MLFGTPRGKWASALVATALLTTLAARANDMATDAEIEAAVVDKTFQGSMIKNAFAEYYDADGSIKGEGYSGKWRAADNMMCFTYGDKPEACWKLQINGPAVTLYKDGKVDGSGMLVNGNPNDF